MNNRKYIIGRRGHIRLYDKTTSSLHAELMIKDDSLYLTDLKSTNGTYLMQEGKRQRFDKGYVDMDQVLAFGEHVCSVRELVARAQII